MRPSQARQLADLAAPVADEELERRLLDAASLPGPEAVSDDDPEHLGARVSYNALRWCRSRVREGRSVAAGTI
jgi:hypothetical protein